MKNTKAKKNKEKSFKISDELDMEALEGKKKTKEYTVRTSETGDKVYLIKEGKRQWIKNPETLEELGFHLGQEETVEYDELIKFEEGEAIDLTEKVEKSKTKKTTKKGRKPILGYREVA